MKFSQLSDQQAHALSQFYMLIVQTTVNDSQEYVRHGSRQLALGNGAGVLILTTFMAAIVQKGDSLSYLLVPLLLFIIGTVSASWLNFPFIRFMGESSKHFAVSTELFFRDKIDIEELVGYEFTSKTIKQIGWAIRISIGCFITGIIACVVALYCRT